MTHNQFACSLILFNIFFAVISLVMYNNFLFIVCSLDNIFCHLSMCMKFERYVKDSFLYHPFHHLSRDRRNLIAKRVCVIKYADF